MFIKPFLSLGLGIAAAANCVASNVTIATRLDQLPTLSAGASCACARLSATFGTSVLNSNSTNYTVEAEDFYDIRAVLAPRCIFLPNDAAQVASGMAIIASCGAQFAIRGGGHMNVRVTLVHVLNNH